MPDAVGIINLFFARQIRCSKTCFLLGISLRVFGGFFRTALSSYRIRLRQVTPRLSQLASRLQQPCSARLGRSARHNRPAIASISRALSRPLADEERLSWLIRGR